MPNPSTLTAELEQRYQAALSSAENIRLPKSERETNLRLARSLAEQLGIDGPPAINGRPAEPVKPEPRTLTYGELEALRYQLDRLNLADVGAIAYLLHKEGSEASQRLLGKLGVNF